MANDSLESVLVWGQFANDGHAGQLVARSRSLTTHVLKSKTVQCHGSSLSVRFESYAGTRRPSLLSPRYSFSASVNPVSNIGWAILESDPVCFALPEKMNDFAINQSYIPQVEHNSRDVPLRRDHRFQFGEVFVAYSTDKRENNFPVGAPHDLEHMATIARR